MINRVRTLLWRLLAGLMLLLAAIGVALPVLPTVPFLLVAAWAAGRGWPELEAWLLAHPRYGADIRRWRERGAVSHRAKWFASVAMFASALFVVLSDLPLWLRWSVPLTMAAVAVWLWRRPED
jgi:uncharacterized membrane protein YbaN (DUF454 family)